MSGEGHISCLGIEIENMRIEADAKVPSVDSGVSCSSLGKVEFNKKRCKVVMQPRKDVAFHAFMQTHSDPVLTIAPTSYLLTDFLVPAWKEGDTVQWKVNDSSDSVPGIVYFNPEWPRSCATDQNCLRSAGFERIAGRNLVLHKLLFAIYNLYGSKIGGGQEDETLFENRIKPHDKIMFLKRCLDLSRQDIVGSSSIKLTLRDILSLINSETSDTTLMIAVDVFNTQTLTPGLKIDMSGKRVYAYEGFNLVYTITYNSIHETLPSVELGLPFRFSMFNHMDNLDVHADSEATLDALWPKFIEAKGSVSYNPQLGAVPLVGETVSGDPTKNTLSLFAIGKSVTNVTAGKRLVVESYCVLVKGSYPANATTVGYVLVQIPCCYPGSNGTQVTLPGIKVADESASMNLFGPILPIGADTSSSEYTWSLSQEADGLVMSLVPVNDATNSASNVLTAITIV